MVDMDNVYAEIQIFLMKKDQERGELKFLSSRATDENVAYIDEVCKRVAEILRSNRVPMAESKKLTVECVQVYKYLLLNTNFKAQELLVEDLCNGHLVDMCPPLSPYLLIEILWSLGYEELLTESILYLPLDLSVEILAITRNCLQFLEFPRALNTILTLILNISKIFVYVRDHGSQTRNIDENLNGLISNAQELIAKLYDPKFIRIHEASGIKKYERYGIVLKKILNMFKSCLDIEKNGNILPKDIEKLYKVTFGNMPVVQANSSVIKEHLSTLAQDSMNLFLKKFKEISVNIYMVWVELQDPENNSISLQRSIGIDCYYFIEYVNENQLLEQCTPLMECVSQLSCNPNSNPGLTTMNIQELCARVEEGRKDCLKELLCRHKEWDNTILDIIEKQRSLIDKNDCFDLLRNLNDIFDHTHNQNIQERAYSIVITVLFLQDITDIFEIVIDYILMCNVEDTFPNFAEDFKEFITLNANIKMPRNLRIVLYFMMYCPRKVITILLKIVLGCPDYDTVMIPLNDLLVLAPIFKIRDINKEMLLTNILQEICMDNVAWNEKKCNDLINFLIENHVIDIDSIFNNIFIPYLESELLVPSNMLTMLCCISSYEHKFGAKMKVDSLFQALAIKLSTLRKRKDISQLCKERLLNIIGRRISNLSRGQNKYFHISRVDNVIGHVETFLEPMDKLYFDSLWSVPRNGFNVTDVMIDYERKCFSVRNRIKQSERISRTVSSALESIVILREDFLRHLILRSTVYEYTKFGYESTAIYWSHFGWIDKIDALDNFFRITVEAAILSLEIPTAVNPHAFLCLIHGLTGFLREVIRTGLFDDIYRLLIKHIKVLNKSVKQSPYALFWPDITENRFADCTTDIRIHNIMDYFNLFRVDCMKYDVMIEPQNPPSVEMTRFSIMYDFISACLQASTTECYECLTRMDKLLFPQRYSK
ncbi:uncharacterized protein LOC105702027 [Orussus abietinus]|uniref:uncharacterized protein LOC105702027 n=1 Tax=Orussus abietinus TaxID=222816 RepID=UPI000626CD10|nr:uncharacterized protein LOC105702027 [Orussus abietinus]